MNVFRRVSVTIAVGSLLLLPPLVLAASEDANVRKAFDGYKYAVLNELGEDASQLVTQSTIDYFGEMQQLALHGSGTDVRAQSIVNQMQILTFRHRMHAEQLKLMSPRKVFVYAVDQGWVGKNGVVTLDSGPVSVSGDIATIDIFKNGIPTGLKFRLQREAGSWKLDLMPILALGNQAFKLIAKQQRISEEYLVLSLLESVSGQRVPDSIWNPPY